MRRPGAAGPRRRRAVLGAAAAPLVVALLVSGCAGPDETGTLQHRVRAWELGTQFGQTVGTLYGDGARIDELVQDHHGTGAIHTACGVLQDDAGTADSGLPSPDPTLTTDLNDAVQDEYQAGIDCYQAGAANTSLLHKSAALRSQADRLLKAALARADAITGVDVSTTTTTSSDAGSIFG